MILFLKNTALFGLMVFGYFGINYLINHQIIQNSIPDIKTETIVIGASDVQAAIDPNLLSNTSNIALLGETYFMTYWKLKKLLESNEIDTVLLGFTYVDFSTIYDNVLSDKMPLWSQTNFRKIYSISDFSTIKGLDIDKRGFYTFLFKNMCLHPKGSHHHYMGYYSNHPSGTGSVENAKRNLSLHYAFKGEPATISSTAIQQLENMVQLCEEKGIKLILVSPPMHERYLKGIPVEFVDNFDQIKERMRQKGFPILDYSRAKYADDEYYDTCHLNDKGAKRFTKKLRQDLANLEMLKER